MHKKPVIKGTRLTFEYILNLLARGTAVTEILEEYEGLVEVDINHCPLIRIKSVKILSKPPLT